MIESVLRRFLEHRHQKSIVIIVTILTGLLVLLPATDEYNAAREKLGADRLELEQTKDEVSDLPQFKRLAKEKQNQLLEIERRAVSEHRAQKLRTQLVELVRQTGCTMREIRLGDAVRRPWTDADHVTAVTLGSQRGKSTPYELETRQLSLSVNGSMPDLHRFLAQIYAFDQFIHTKSLALKRSERGDNMAILDMDILLFNLIRKTPT